MKAFGTISTVVGTICTIIGFYWLCTSAALYQARGLNYVSDRLEALPRQETYNRAEVENQLIGLGKRFMYSGPRILTPAVLMLLGAICQSLPQAWLMISARVRRAS